MKRLPLLAIPFLLFALFVAFRPAEGQDNLQERVSALETRVTQLENPMTPTMDSQGDTAPGLPTSAALQSPPSNATLLEGTENQGVDGLYLFKGPLHVTVLSDTGMHLMLTNPLGREVTLVNNSGKFDGTVSTPIKLEGYYALHMESKGSWTLWLYQDE